MRESCGRNSRVANLDDSQLSEIVLQPRNSATNNNLTVKTLCFPIRTKFWRGTGHHEAPCRCIEQNQPGPVVRVVEFTISQGGRDRHGHGISRDMRFFESQAFRSQRDRHKQQIEVFLYIGLASFEIQPPFCFRALYSESI